MKPASRACRKTWRQGGNGTCQVCPTPAHGIVVSLHSGWKRDHLRELDFLTFSLCTAQHTICYRVLQYPKIQHTFHNLFILQLVLPPVTSVPQCSTAARAPAQRNPGIGPGLTWWTCRSLPSAKPMGIDILEIGVVNLDCKVKNKHGTMYPF